MAAAASVADPGRAFRATIVMRSAAARRFVSRNAMLVPMMPLPRMTVCTRLLLHQVAKPGIACRAMQHMVVAPENVLGVDAAFGWNRVARKLPERHHTAGNEALPDRLEGLQRR